MKNTVMFDLGGTLAHYFEGPGFPAILEQAKIDQQRRAETLSLEEWAAVYRAATEKR